MVIKPSWNIIKSYIMSIVIPVHLRIVRCHQIKKRHQYDCCSWRYLQSWRKSFPWSGETHHVKPSVDGGGWGGCSADSAIRLIVECSIGESSGQDGVDFRVKRQTQDFWRQQKQAHVDFQTHLGSWLKQQLVWLKASVQFSSVAQSCPTICDPMNRSMPGLLHVHWYLSFSWSDL